MKTIHKYTLLPNQIDYELPVEAKILTAHAQDNNLCIWAEVDPAQPLTESRRIFVFGTGHIMPEDPLRYIATVHINEFVFHVYED